MPTEAQEQERIFEWAAWMQTAHPELRLMHHIPNGGYRNPREAARLQREGVRPGIPDIFLPCARGGHHGLYIELKRRDGGRLSEKQGTMIAALREEGYRVEVCHGADEAIRVIAEYLKAKSWNDDWRQ